MVDVGSVACAEAATVTNASGMPRMLVKSSATLAVITTCTHEYWPAPWQARGIGLPGSATGGELTVTLLTKPRVALHASPATSNHVVLNAEPVEASHPFE